MRFEESMALTAKKYGLRLEWRRIKFGYRQAKIACDSNEELSAVMRILGNMKKVWVSSWACHSGEFEGYVYAMDQSDHDEFESKREAERQRLEDWWMRYHLADTETRRLMACGKIG